MTCGFRTLSAMAPRVPRGRIGVQAGIASVLAVVAGVALTRAAGADTRESASTLVAVLACLGTFLVGLLRRSGGVFGPADTVTLVRATLAAWCAGWMVLTLAGEVPAQSWWLLGVAVGALVLDGVDGEVARRTGTAGISGGRLDAETDAALILVLAVVAAHTVGWWVLASGLMRYLFALGGRLRPRWRAPLPTDQARRVVAATQGGVLAGVSAPVVPGWLAVTACVVGLALLLWSFTRDVVALDRGTGSS